MLSFDVLQVQEAATYSWSWDIKHGTERSTPVVLNFCPFNLLIDMVKNCLQGNWRRQNSVLHISYISLLKEIYANFK